MTLELTIQLPIRLVSESNARGHWARRYRRSAEQRAVVRMALASLKTWSPQLPAEVTIVRIAPRELDAHDNLRAAAKGLVDGIADALGLESDRDERVTWRYLQERAGVREYAVRVEVREVI